MIYTVTFNPAIDLVVESELNIGELNRARKEDYLVGGKGIIVAQTARELGADVTATGFVGGFTAAYISESLEARGIHQKFVMADGITRVNLKVVSDDNQLTELNMHGVKVNRQQFGKLKKYLDKQLNDQDVLVICGNPSEGLGPDDYAELCGLANEKNAKLVVYTRRNCMEKCMPYHPWLVKPDIREMNDMVLSRVQGTRVDFLLGEARKMIKAGAGNVLISDGPKGSLLVGEDGTYIGDPIEGEPVNTMGAGDSMLAAVIVRYLETGDYKNAFEWGIAAASATAFSNGLGSIDSIKDLLKDVYVVKQEDPADERRSH